MIMVDESKSLAVCNKSDFILEASYEDQLAWLKEMGEALKSWGNIEDKSINSQAEILWLVWSIWDTQNNHNGVSLRDEAKSDWDYDFYRWAKSYTKRRALREPADETITNKVTIHRDWIAEQVIEYPEYIYLPPRDHKGKIIEEEVKDETKWTKVEADPREWDYGKKLVARGTARRGEMTPEAWTALADPFATVNDLKDALNPDRQNSSNRTDDFYIFEDNGIIYGCANGKQIAVFQALFENSTDELFNKTMVHVLRSAGVKVEARYR